MIFGYLDAVHRYHVKDPLQQYAFSTLAWKAMNRSLSNYRRSLLRRSRRAQETILYKEDGTQISMQDCISTFSYDPTEDLKMRLLLYDLASVIPQSQMAIVRMRLDGCSVRQIAKQHNMTMKQVQTQLKAACTVLKQLCYDT